jgi:hypothetical protein
MIDKRLQAILAVSVALAAYAGWEEWRSGMRVEADVHLPAGRESDSPMNSSESGPGHQNSGASTLPNAVQVAIGTMDIFPAQSWKPPPAAPSAPAVSNVPEKPVFPFRFLGEWRDGRQRFIAIQADGKQFLLCESCAGQDRYLPGSTILDVWHIEQLGEHEILFRHLQLGHRQSLPIGDAT